MRRLIPVLVVVLVAAGILSYLRFGRVRKVVPGQVPMLPLAADELAVHVRALAAVDVGKLGSLLGQDAALSAWAGQLGAKASSDDARARALVAALQARKQKQAFVEWTRVEARDGLPLTAAATLAAIQQDGKRAELYPLELSALAVAGLRSLGVSAFVAEVYRYPDERAALDPSGHFGYHAVFVGADPQRGGQLYDAYAGRSVAPAAGDYAVLDDVQAIGAALTISALDKLSNQHDPDAALGDARAALKLIPKSPSVHGALAEVVLSREDGAEEGKRELDAALALRNDAPRHRNLAVYYMGRNLLDAAAEQLKAALDAAPDYASAQVLQCAWSLMRSDFPSTRSCLERAQKLEPKLALLPQIYAQFYAKAQELELALKSASTAVELRPKDPQPLFILARIERAAGHEAEMRKHARELIALIPPADRTRRENQLRSALGPDVLAPLQASDAGTAAP